MRGKECIIITAVSFKDSQINFVLEDLVFTILSLYWNKAIRIIKGKKYKIIRVPSLLSSPWNIIGQTYGLN